MSHAGAGYWDAYFRRLRESGSDLDWRGRWTEPFIPLLRTSGAQTVLELGCGTGSDAVRLARAGFDVTAVDLSSEAVARARGRAEPGTTTRFLVVDIADGLPFESAAFDAVMANVALHMFPEDVTRAVFDDVRRVVRPGGLLLVHVNALADRPLRARRRRVVRELEADYVLEEGGQTVRFFSRAFLVDLLAAWDDVQLEHVEISDERTGEPFKRVWRAVAR